MTDYLEKTLSQNLKETHNILKLGLEYGPHWLEESAVITHNYYEVLINIYLMNHAAVEKCLLHNATKRKEKRLASNTILYKLSTIWLLIVKYP